MDATRFDTLAKAVATGTTRRLVLRSVAAALGIGATPALGARVRAQTGFICCDYSCQDSAGDPVCVPDTINCPTPLPGCTLSQEVTVASCEDCGAQPPPPTLPPGSTFGEPHLTTPDGFAYDFQAAGEFILLSSLADDFAVQVRQQPWKSSTVVSINTAVAMAVAGDRVGVYTGEDPALHVNGEPTALVDGTATPLPQGGRIEQLENRYTIIWPDGTAVGVADELEFLTVVVHLAAARAGQVAGLLGNADGDPSNDLVTRDGEPIDLTGLPQDDAHTQLYQEFGDSWRISQAESLFDYAPGEDTETFTLLDFPTAPIAVSDLPPAAQVEAEAICREAGITEASLLAACILDVGVTGNPAFAAGAAGVEATLRSVPPPQECCPGPVCTCPCGCCGDQGCCDCCHHCLNPDGTEKPEPNCCHCCVH
jgi:hypothetical protein